MNSNVIYQKYFSWNFCRMAGFDLQLDNDGTYSVATFFYFCVQIGIGLVVLFRYMVMRPVDMKKILFVCLGNICRSSTAEGVMLHLIEEAGLEKEFVIDSAGILSYHQGELPDSRMRAHAARRGYQLVHRSRPVRTEDFYNFDLIIGMDDRNIDDLKEKAPSTEEWKKIHRMTEYCTRIPADHVPDPYYGGAEGFEYVLDVLEDACAGLLTSLTQDN